MGDYSKLLRFGLTAILLGVAAPPGRCQSSRTNPKADSLIAPGAELQKLSEGLQFGEGPAADADGNVFFSDIRADQCLKWSVEGKLSTFRTDTGSANGQCFDHSGNLIACEGGRGRLVSVDRQGRATIVVDQYQGKRFNAPNDLWIDPRGGIYFSDPLYGRGVKSQDGEHVYYLKPDRKTVMPVITDFVRPNGLVGTPDGKVLYASDHGAKKIYAYDIGADGSLSNKRFFAPVGADGMTLDNAANLYFCEDAVLVYDPSGNKIGTIEVPDQPTNVCFGGRDAKTLFITTRPALYSIRMRTGGTAKSPRLPLS
jgi:gluconolactonase